jgi:glutamate---cysteine ligase / carboxylate-amine ligase
MPYKLMEVFGIELEYMLVDKENLNVLPIADQVFKKIMGEVTNIVSSPRIDWSNELVNHVIEFKNNKPEPCLVELTALFQEQIQRANKELAQWNAQLMPSAMHPWMNPDTETKLWPHENNEIYNAYDRIFGCRGHGWANLQSLHINISFDTDKEFHKLHSAIRFFLPLIPALSSSSPFVEGESQGYSSHRLSFYLKNQRKIPSIIGQAIPEVIHSNKEYQDKILSPMYKDISPLDPDGILQEEWLNSRGAIPKFERGCIEIRLADVQEAPIIDLSIAQFWIKAIEKFMNGSWISMEESETLSPQELKVILEKTVLLGENALIDDTKYLACFGLSQPMTAQELLKEIFSQLKYDPSEESFKVHLNKILEKGSLSTRIKKNLSDKPKRDELKAVYRKLCHCLNEGIFFEN